MDETYIIDEIITIVKRHYEEASVLDFFEYDSCAEDIVEVLKESGIKINDDE